MLLFIPSYNCEKQLPRVLKQITPEIASYFDEIIIVNNRSTDHTEQIATTFKIPKSFPKYKVLRNDHNYGLGGSHKVAFDYAIKHHHDYIVILHGDDQGDIKDLLPILKSKSYQSFDATLGARFMPQSTLKGYSKFRTFGNRVYNRLFSLVTHEHIYDLGSGLNLYKVSALKTNFYHKFPDHLTFNYCMILAHHYYHHKTQFFPISWREDDQKSNVKLISQALTVLKLLSRYTINHNYIKSELRKHPVKEYTYREVKHV